MVRGAVAPEAFRRLRLDHFGYEEFPPGVERHVEPLLFITYDLFRKRLGRKVFPSPAERAWWRLGAGDEESRHYAVGRKSDAGDAFPDGPFFDAWLCALSIGSLGGIGIYADTQLDGAVRPMLHLDLRPRGARGPLLWARAPGREGEGTRYVYPARGGEEREAYLAELAKACRMQP